MIQALTLQDPSKPLVVNLPPKKPVQSGYFFNDTSSTTIEMGMPSITFSSSKHTPSKDDIVIPMVKKHEEEKHGIPLPTAEVICLGYICYTICMGIGAILFSYYLNHLAFFFCPLFTLTVVGHILLHFHVTSGVMGGVLIVLYPLVADCGVSVAYIVFLFCFMAFCLVKVISHKINIMFIALMLLLVVCAVIGIIVYEVYPRSIHGLHASFLCTCILACTSVMILPKQHYKIVAI